MKILFLSHTYYGGIYRVGSHELSEIAIAQGHSVLHVSTPVTPLHYLREFFRRRKDSARYSRRNLENWSKVPFILIPLQYSLSKFLPGGYLRKIFRNKYDLIFIDQPYFLRHIKLLNSRSNIFLRLTDIISDPKQRSLIKKNLPNISGVSFTNDLIRQNLDIPARDTIVIPNGVSRMAVQIELAAESRRGIVYLGALDQRIDWNFIQQLSRTPNFEYLHLYGSGKIPDKLPQGVTYLGPIYFEESLIVLNKYKYIVLPYKNNEINRGRSPMKLANAITLGLIPIIPDWMNVHDEFLNRGFKNIYHLYLEGKSHYEAKKNKTMEESLSWEDNFHLLVDWAMKLSTNLRNIQ